MRERIKICTINMILGDRNNPTFQNFAEKIRTIQIQITSIGSY